MSNSKGLYEKADKAFQNGYIDKAMEFCEKSIAENLRNSAAVNLKGLIYYFKGDLDFAETTWKLNLENNSNAIAEKYLKNIENDRKLFSKYVKAMKLIENYKINEAIEILKECEVSSFNNINISVALCRCYIKKGEITKTEYYLSKVMELDKKNPCIEEIEEALNLYGDKKENLFSKLAIITIILLVVSIISYTGYVKRDYILGLFSKATPVEEPKDKGSKEEENSKTKESDEEANKDDLTGDEEKTEDVKEEEIAKEEETVETSGEEENREIYNSENLSNLLGEKDKDYNTLYDEYKLSEGKEIVEEDLSTIKKAEDLLKRRGIEYFYAKGLNNRDDKKYDEAISYFKKAEEFMEGSYLRPHILYFLGICYQRKGEITETEKYYNTYVTDYPKGSYGSTAVYYLATYYKDKDIEKAKEYANLLRNNYPKSKENNDTITYILNK